MWGILRRNPLGTLIALIFHASVIALVFVGTSNTRTVSNTTKGTKIINARVVSVKEPGLANTRPQRPKIAPPPTKPIANANLLQSEPPQQTTKTVLPELKSTNSLPTPTIVTTHAESTITAKNPQISAEVVAVAQQRVATNIAEEQKQREIAATMAEEQRQRQVAATLAEEQRQRDVAATVAEEQRQRDVAATVAEEQRQRDVAATVAEEQRQRDVAAKVAEEQRQRDVAAKVAEEQRQRDVAAKVAEEQRQRELATKVAEEQRQRELATKVAEEQRQRELATKIAEEQRQLAVAAKKARLPQSENNNTNVPKSVSKQTEAVAPAITTQHNSQHTNAESTTDTSNASYSPDHLEQQDNTSFDELQEIGKEIRALMRRTWRVPADSENLRCTLKVRISRTGKVLAIRILKSSGNRLFDASAERAVKRASPLPVPKNPKLFDENWELVFDPTAD